MFEFRVTKYDPKKRNEAGHYLLAEWTCFSEVGDSVCLEEYERVEGAYLQSAIDFARVWSAEGFTISGLEDCRQYAVPPDCVNPTVSTQLCQPRLHKRLTGEVA